MVNPFDANPFLVGGFPVSTLSMIVAGIAMAPAALSAKLAQMGAPAFPRLVLNHISGTGFLMAGACTDPFAKVTTGLLGKVRGWQPAKLGSYSFRAINYLIDTF